MKFSLGILLGVVLGAVVGTVAPLVHAQFDTPGLPYDGGLELSRQLRDAEQDRQALDAQRREFEQERSRYRNPC